MTPSTIDQLHIGSNDIKSTWRTYPSTYSLGPMPTQPGSSAPVGTNTISDSYQPSQNNQNNAYEQTDPDIPKEQTPIEQSTEVTWMGANPDNNNIRNDRESTINIMPSSRTRPSSYGRASSWMPSQPSETTQKPTWATMSTWHVYSQDTGEKPQATETWYPAAGSYVGNSIDEPNQQGLSKLPNNNGNTFHLSLSLFSLLFCFYIVN